MYGETLAGEKALGEKFSLGSRAIVPEPVRVPSNLIASMAANY